ncbi:MAG: ureidoglycolate lyase [Sulfitobacter sp.]
MKLAQKRRITPHLNLACSRTFEPYGKLVPAGPPEEHLMDAKIFRSLQNNVTRPEWVKLSEPKMQLMKAAPYERGEMPHTMMSYQWERTIIVPDMAQDYALSLAIGQDGQPETQTFRIGAGLAVNLKSGVWFSAVYSLNQGSKYWIISGSGQPQLHNLNERAI